MLNKIRTKIKEIFVARFVYWINTRIYGMDIHPSAMISSKAMLDKCNPKGIHIGEETAVAPGVCIMAHNCVIGRGVNVDTRVGKNVLLGVNAIILPGVTIHDNVIIGAGAVVTKDVPSNCVVAGNPARIIRANVNIGKDRRIISD